MQSKRVMPAVIVMASGLGAIFDDSSALAEQRRCKGLRLVSVHDLEPRWARAVLEAQAQLPVASPRECPAIEVSVEPLRNGMAHDRELLLHVVAADGRRTERIVGKPSALAATIYGLVAPLPEENTEPLRGQAQAEAKTVTMGTAETKPANTAGALASGVWLGLAIGGRVSEPVMAMLDVEGRADLMLQSWFLFASFRYSTGVAGHGDDAATYSEADVGLGAGRRFPLWANAIDVAFVPSLATMRFDHHDESGHDDGSLAELRLGVSVRWSLPLAPSWRIGLTIDSDLAPEGLARPVRTQADLPPLPAWTAGARLGASGRLL